MNTIRIERKSADGLTMQVWEFGDSKRSPNEYTLDFYSLNKRLTTKKRTWTPVRVCIVYGYYYEHRYTEKIPLDLVPIPSDLLDEVRQAIINQIKVSVQ